MAERTFCVNLPLNIWWISSHSSVDPFSSCTWSRGWSSLENQPSLILMLQPAKGNLQLGGAYRGCLLSLGKKVAWWFCYKTRYYDDGMWLGHTSTPTGSVFTFYTSPISILVLPSNILTNQPVAFVLASRSRLYGRHFCLFLCYRGNCKVLESSTPPCNIKVSCVDSLSLVIESVTNV